MSWKTEYIMLLFKWEYINLGIYVPVSKPWICFWKWVISTKEQVAYSQHQFDRLYKECMLPAALDCPGDKSHHSVLALGVPGFSQSCYHYELKVFCETGYNSALYNIIENVK